MRKYFILRFFALLILGLTVLNPSVADAETKIVFEEDGEGEKKPHVLYFREDDLIPTY